MIKTKYHQCPKCGSIDLLAEPGEWIGLDGLPKANNEVYMWCVQCKHTWVLKREQTNDGTR